MKAAPRTGVTGGHQVHTQIKAASTECDFPRAHFPEGLLCEGATATGMPKTLPLHENSLSGGVKVAA